MTIRYLKKHAALEGHIGVDDAEPLAQWLLKQPKPVVHLAKCEHVHAAVLQVLLALQPRLTGSPADATLARVLAVANTTATPESTLESKPDTKPATKPRTRPAPATVSARKAAPKPRSRAAPKQATAA